MKILGFLIRLFLVAALIVWLADRPGSAQIVWRDYQIDTSAAVLAVMVLAFAYGAILLHRLWRFVWDGPRFWRLRRRISKMEEGEKILGQGLAAIAAGQPVEAGRLAVKARHLIGETPVSRLIQAQAAQLAGEEERAKSLFEALTHDKDTAVLGFRGLIMAALKRGDFDEASRAAYRLEQTKTDVPWLHLVRFELGARMQNWTLASEALGKARKGKALPAPQADKHEAALLLARAKAALREGAGREALEYAEKAKKLAPDWMPAALVLAETQIAGKHERAALRTILRAYEREPHPQLILLAGFAVSGAKPIDAYKTVEKIARQAPDSPVSLMALAEAALRAGLWGECRRFLMTLVSKGGATQRTYQLLASLERQDTGNDTAGALWLAKAAAAARDPEWLCGACGAAHEHWAASCEFCGAFNRLSWDTPGQGRAAALPAAKTELLAFLGHD